MSQQGKRRTTKDLAADNVGLTWANVDAQIPKSNELRGEEQKKLEEQIMATLPVLDRSLMDTFGFGSLQEEQHAQCPQCERVLLHSHLERHVAECNDKQLEIYDATEQIGNSAEEAAQALGDSMDLSCNDTANGHQVDAYDDDFDEMHSTHGDSSDREDGFNQEAFKCGVISKLNPFPCQNSIICSLHTFQEKLKVARSKNLYCLIDDFIAQKSGRALPLEQQYELFVGDYSGGDKQKEYKQQQQSQRLLRSNVWRPNVNIVHVNDNAQQVSYSTDGGGVTTGDSLPSKDPELETLVQRVLVARRNVDDMKVKSSTVYQETAQTLMDRQRQRLLFTSALTGKKLKFN
ncbi:hypothetical protein MP228_007968 [Amoeboaphelidium protococcarum]|nr:hypothetical protein MP228_007968 [Amoeboaphelidium protococcarum]